MNKKTMDLLHRIKIYMETAEEYMDQDFKNRDASQLLKDGEMPKEYFELIEILEEEAPKLSYMPDER